MTDQNGPDDDKVTRFPDAREREALEKAHIVHHTPAREPFLNLPPVVQILCLLNIAVFLCGKFFPQLLTDDLLYALAFVPARYFGADPIGGAAIFSPVTYMFIHGGWMHLSLNVAMLMAFGAGLEKFMGGRRLLLLYFATGLCGAMAQLLVYPHTDSPMIGASGGISGLFGGVMIMMYSSGMLGQGYRKLLPVIFIWIGISVFFGFFGMPGVDSPIAWTAHVGGFIGGLLLYGPISRLKIQH